MATIRFPAAYGLSSPNRWSISPWVRQVSGFHE